MKIDQKYAQLLFAFMMSVLMASIMSGILTALYNGLNTQFVGKWFHSFIVAWPITFPCIVILAPIVQKIVKKLTS